MLCQCVGLRIRVSKVVNAILSSYLFAKKHIVNLSCLSSSSYNKRVIGRIAPIDACI